MKKTRIIIIRGNHNCGSCLSALGGRLRRGILIRATSFNPPVETDGYDVVYA